MERSAIFLASGLAASIAGAGMDPIVETRGLRGGDIRDVAHIYFNIGTGEKVVTLLHGDAQRPADTDGSGPYWSQTTTQMCLAQGYSTELFYSPDDLSMVDSMGNPLSSLALESLFTDWGDMPTDVVVDCVQVHWVTTFPDTDTDMDSFADGIPGLAAEWTIFSNYNGRSPQDGSIQVGLIGFGFFNLPGLPPSFTGEFGKYTVDVDLTASGTFGTDLTMELGDTDSDFQGARFGLLANGNSSLPGYFTDFDSDGFNDGDPDDDGLADWGWGVTFVQPGRQDVDNADFDSDTQTGIDGDFADASTIGVAFAVLDGGSAVDDGSGGWVWDDMDPNRETEDVFTQYLAYAYMGIPSGTNAGPFFFGGLDCTPGMPSYVPSANFQIVLYSPGSDGMCFGLDLTGDDALDFFDISYLVQNEVDWNGDTSFDFFDISGYLQAILGCPTIP
jgi:hypothetical protein